MTRIFSSALLWFSAVCTCLSSLTRRSHFRFLLRNRWMEFDYTLQQASTKRYLQILCFWADWKNKDDRPCLWLTDFSRRNAERNLTKLDRKQVLSVIYQVCVCEVNRKIKIVALASDWLRHFLLLLWNRLTAFDETCSKHSLSSFKFVFWGPPEKKDDHPGLWLAETCLTFLCNSWTPEQN